MSDNAARPQGHIPGNPIAGQQASQPEAPTNSLQANQDMRKQLLNQ
jgi:hypothetical protein